MITPHISIREHTTRAPAQPHLHRSEFFHARNNAIGARKKQYGPDRPQSRKRSIPNV
jgi:hypothetical protein